MDDGEESLEELDLDDAAVISHQSEVHAPARRQAVQVDQPSVVVQQDPDQRQSGSRNAATRRARRALEPTLLVRDRRADDMRLEMEKRVRELKRRQLRSTLAWVVAGLLAFALGGLIALLAQQRMRGSSEEKAEQSEQSGRLLDN